MKGRGENQNGGVVTEMKILPIWTLGEPHNASRHKSVTTSSSFMVVVRFLARCPQQPSVADPTKTSSLSYIIPAHGVIPGSLRLLQMPYRLSWDARALLLLLLLLLLECGRAPRLAKAYRRGTRPPRRADSCTWSSGYDTKTRLWDSRVHYHECKHNSCTGLAVVYSIFWIFFIQSFYLISHKKPILHGMIDIWYLPWRTVT